MLFVFKNIMDTLFDLDVRRRISKKDEGIYIHDLPNNETIELGKASNNSYRIKDQFLSPAVAFHDFKLRA